MKSTAFIIIFISSCLSLFSQNFIVPLTERGYISCEKETYNIGDTLSVKGVILSTDYNDFYPYSHYVNVELINNSDSVVEKQKVIVSQNGCFFATILTNHIHYQGRYFLRAYTQFMCNQPAVTFPMNSVNLTMGSKMTFDVTSHPANRNTHRINIRDLGKKLRIYVADAQSDMELYCFQSGFGLLKLNVQPGKAISFDISEIPDGLLTFWLRSGDKTLDEISVWVGEIHNHKISLSEFDNNAVKPTIIKRVVEDNGNTLHAFESLNILQHVHSDLPFPESFYHVSSDSAKIMLNNWLASAHFIGFDLQNAINGTFDYPVNPEKSLSIKGKAKKKSKKLIENGTVEILNVTTLDNHICQLDSIGHFEQPIADFADGNRFFLEAKDNKGSGRKNIVYWEEDTIPLMENWIPRLQYSAKTLQAKDFLKHIDIDPNDIMLDDVIVNGKKSNVDILHKSQMKGMYAFDYDDLQRNFRNLRSVIEHCGMIYFTYEDTYGGSGTSASQSERTPSDLVAVWRSGRNTRLNTWSGNWMMVLLDNVLYSHGYGSLFDMSTDELESVEVIPPRTSDPRLIANNAPNGLIILKSNFHHFNLRDIPSNGITVQPLGISYPLKADTENELTPGPGQHYAVDVITPSQQIISWEE